MFADCYQLDLPLNDYHRTAPGACPRCYRPGLRLYALESEASGRTLRCGSCFDRAVFGTRGRTVR